MCGRHIRDLSLFPTSGLGLALDFLISKNILVLNVVPTTRAKNRGRPRGPKKIPILLRVSPEQKRGLKILSELMEGTPPVNGLIQAAIEQFINRKLTDPVLRAQYNAKAAPSLKVLA